MLSSFPLKRCALAHDAARSLLPLYAATLFLGALILFAIQPMFTKMVLPLLGGTPAVWNTAVMFFQGMLLAGYLYAHLLSRRRGLRGQVLIHMGILALGLLFLPIRVAADLSPVDSARPVLWLVGLLTVSIGLPFFAVSATAPLLQRWFSRSGHPHADDPYFLYGASNAGGLLALLAYPIAVEPLFALTQQSVGWSAGYALLIFGMGLCAVGLWATQLGRSFAAADERAPVVTPPSNHALSDRIGWAVRARWVALAFVPSALLLAVTLHISTDVASVPFLWVVPLSLYLLSFILTFARRPVLKHRWMLHLQIWIYALLAIYFTENELWVILALHLVTLFVTAMVCHGELVQYRPAAEHLTEFYVWISVGGLVGGVFCTLIAPVAFDWVLEYPLVLVLASLLRPGLRRQGIRPYVLDVILPAAFVAAHFLIRQRLDLDALGATGPILFYGATALVLLAFRNRPLRLTLGFAPVLFGSIFLDQVDHRIFRRRSFFGVYTVSTDAAGSMHKLYHGTTVHGNQSTDPEAACIPTSYYSWEGPLGQVFTAMRTLRPLEQVGAVGLGTGTMACYQEPGQVMTFFEVDPAVERIARDPNLFRYLDSAGDGVEIVIGDGRQGLRTMQDHSFDLLSLDAFSSDAIPVHLLTREAMSLYMSKLAPGGIVMVHISNRYVDLEPVLANLVLAAGLPALIQEYDPTSEEYMAGASACTWVAVARNRSDLAMLESDGRWRPLEPDARAGIWTDDYSNLLGVLRWGNLFHLP